MCIGLTAVSSIRNSYFLRGYLRLVMCTRHCNLITFKFVLFCSLNGTAVFLILKIESRSEISQKSDLCKLTGDCKGPTKLFAYWISIEIILYTCRHISFFLCSRSSAWTNWYFRGWSTFAALWCCIILVLMCLLGPTPNDSLLLLIIQAVPVMASPLPVSLILVVLLLAKLLACQAGDCKGYRQVLRGPPGYVTDGPGNYSVNGNCEWLIKGILSWYCLVHRKIDM